MTKMAPIGLLAAAVVVWVAWGAFAGESNRLSPDSAAYKAMRNAAFAQAGLPTWSQCARGHPSNDCMIVDHIVPLCLKVKGNTLDNIQIQPCADWTGRSCVAGPAFDKDKQREDPACAAVRAGRTTPEAAAAQFKREWP